jgi:HEPN domain-containing protein
MNKTASKSYKEWMDQSTYDFETANAMFKAARYIYAVFMCHLAVEKALKGVYAKTLKKEPPKTHDLTYLVKNITIELPYGLGLFVDDLNDLSVPTRYPDELKGLLRQYNKLRTKKMLSDTKEVLQWLKKQ